VPKVHNKPIKRPRKRVQTKEQRDNRRHPGLAHRTVRCATGQCPVHQGTPSGTLHLRKISEALHYNSPDCSVHHRTVSGAPRPCDSELASFGNPLRYNSPDMSGAHRTVRCNGRATATSRQRSPAEAFNARQSAQRSSARAGGTPDSLQGLSGAPPDSRRAHTSELQRSNPNGRVTWLAHRTLSGGAPDCPVRPSTAAFTKRLVWWLRL
jgi:hypothetical protein